jgi:hypothetical protein
MQCFTGDTLCNKVMQAIKEVTWNGLMFEEFVMKLSYIGNNKLI